MRKQSICIIILLLVVLLFTTPVLAEDTKSNYVTRLSGLNRYETAAVIANEVNNTITDNVVIAMGNAFADAISASVLAHKVKAPILLVDLSVEGSNEAFNYISQHLYKDGNIYLVGGTDVIPEAFTKKLNELGFNNVKQIGGRDRYETSSLIADEVKVEKRNPVFIAAGSDFADALSASPFAANQGYPILLTRKGSLPQSVKEFIQSKQPNLVYIVSNTDLTSTTLEHEIKTIVSNTTIVKLYGNDRYETNYNIVNFFVPNPKQLYLATGLTFADALSGSPLAAITGDPIILINPYSPINIRDFQTYQLELNVPITILGGTKVIPDSVIADANNNITGITDMDKNQLVQLVELYAKDVVVFNRDQDIAPLDYIEESQRKLVLELLYEVKAKEEGLGFAFNLLNIRVDNIHYSDRYLTNTQFLQGDFELDYEIEYQTLNDSQSINFIQKIKGTMALRKIDSEYKILLIGKETLSSE